MLEEVFQDVYTKFKLHFYQNVFQRFATREATLTTVESFCMEGIMAMGEPTIAEFSRMMRISIVRRFYSNLLGREGYLMHTLPVTEAQLVGAKLISGTVWSVCSIFAAGLSFGILAILMMAEIDLLDQLPWMLSQLREAFARYDMAFWEMMLFSGLVCFVRMVSAIACIYAACMVGHQFKSHPALAGILSFFGMQYVQGWIEKLLRVGAGVYETALYTVVGDAGSIQTTLSAQGFMGCAALTLGIAAAFGVFWFGLTVWLMRNRLNME